ncbi:iron-containing alcohol dehydrogenase [Neorhizobium sp. NCHU2750]|uniref:iron-containing alcohol dehydrogenase n=1 Tax=Neorhizobium sp. NCHU2750 TaxID=1825976 RepID=UPI000EB6B1AD|nr:alcohol dehydrogenase [Neorhizobium sp. NCHU2750]
MVRELNCRNPLFVTDRSLAELPIVHRSLAGLKESGIRFGLFSRVQPNPTGQSIDDGVDAFSAGGHDMVIAFGGGSALDAGKAIALMARQRRPIWDFEDIGDNWKLVDPRDPVPVIALPTTAGTGSELGRSSVITDTGQGRKLIIFHPIMMPQIAVLDPELTYDLPAALTASTGMDALCHALETYITPSFHPMADGLAMQALRMIKRALPKAYSNGPDPQARADMLVASGMACVALQKGLGGVHAISHALGAVYDAPHGLLNAVLLPYVTEFNRSVAEERLTEIAYVLDLQVRSGEGVIAWLRQMQMELSIPTRLEALGIGIDRLDDVIALAMTDPCAPANPVPLTPHNLRALLLSAI